MWRKVKYLLLSFMLATQPIFSQYEINSNCEKAWKAIINLRFITADSLISNELEINPTNYYAYYLDQMKEAYMLIADQSQERYKQFCDSYEKRIDFIEGKDTESEYYLSCLAEMQLQMGVFNILFDDKLCGLRHCYCSYKNTYKNLRKHPEYRGSRKLKGIYYIAVDNLPPFVSWAANTFGIEGDYQWGYKILDYFFHHYSDTPGLAQEAALCNILAFKLNKDPQSAYNFISQLDTSFLKYNLIQYFNANVNYLTGHNEEALTILQNSSLDSAEVYFNGYNYLMGKILLRKLDTNSISYFDRYLKNNHHKQYEKEITHKKAVAYLIEGDIERYTEYVNIAQKSGEEITERDREAVYDLDIDYIPDITLTKAFLSLKGGYYAKARYYLDNFNNNECDFLPYRLRYNLLNGIYYFKEGYNFQAEACFNKVLEEGSDSKYYFASEAAMYLGMIYENIDNNTANEYYDLALSLYETEYYEYISDYSKKKLESY